MMYTWVKAAREESRCAFYSARASSTGASARGGVFFFFQAEDGIRDKLVTGVQTCALPISVERDPADGALAKGQLALELAGDCRVAVDQPAREAAARRVEHPHAHVGRVEIGRASCRERV